MGQAERPRGGLERTLARFASLLRALGVPVGSGEVLDAVLALGQVDLLDRQQVRMALAATLAKDPRSREILERAFELAFVTPEESQARLEARAGREALRAERLAAAEADLRFQGQPLDLSGEQRDAYARLSAAEQQRLREFLSRSSEGRGVDGSFMPLIEHIVRGHLGRWRRELGDQPRTPRSTGDEELDEVVREIEAGTGSMGDPVLHLDMRDIAEADLPRARALIRRLAKRLATRIMRRYRLSRRHERIDFRRTVRANLRYGGTPVELRYRSRRILKPKIVLICDVSGSMARHASFILQFSFGLAKVVRDIEVFLFAEDLEHVSLGVRRAAALDAAVVGLVEESRVWGKGTNLAAALRRLVDQHRQTLSQDALLLVVSDTKTLAVEEASALLAGVRRRVRDIIWLNPIPARQWPELPTVAALAPHVRMYESSTLFDLERVLRQAVFGPQTRGRG